MKKLNIRFPSAKECHCWCIGFGEALSFFIKPNLPMHSSSYNPIYAEEHYYAMGRGMGILLYVAITFFIICKTLGW